jgi:hypothetical protein
MFLIAVLTAQMQSDQRETALGVAGTSELPMECQIGTDSGGNPSAFVAPSASDLVPPHSWLA